MNQKGNRDRLTFIYKEILLKEYKRLRSSGLTTIEKRKYPRVYTNTPLSYALKNDDVDRIKEGLGRAVNISQGGILIETNTAFKWQDILQLSLNVEGEFVTISGKVVYCNAVDSGTFHTGIEFFKINEKILSFVIGLLKSYL
jgi:hypothetical protein